MKIVIIKLGAKGDVVRTLPILPALKEKYADSEVHWITRRNALEIIQGNPDVNKIICLPDKPEGKYDLLFNFDIDEEATNIANEIVAEKKYGFYNEGGYPATFNLSSEYYLNTVFDDEIKINNKKTYQEMIFECAELEYKKQSSHIFLDERERSYAKKFAERNGIKTERLIGIHIGASLRWPSKSWHYDNIIDFVKKAKEKGYEILLFCGADESEKQRDIVKILKKEGIGIFTNDSKNSDKEFFSLIGLCKAVVCSDSFALHVALSLKKPTVGLFFCTSPDEVEDYGLLRKIVAPKIYDFFPKRMDEYNEELTKSIGADEVIKKIEEIMKG